ncbi:MAG: hypothetical protein R3321_05335 [Nitrososphaeraceae archaeon]|nr:hypothetical protein [Nitrososphaeraceae archaeon]
MEKQIRVVAKNEVSYVFKKTGRRLFFKVGQEAYMTKEEIYDMGSLFHHFFIVNSPDTVVEMFNDDPNILYQQWQERNLING